MPRSKKSSTVAMDRLFVKILARLGQLTVKEDYLGKDVHAMWEPDGTITINPAVSVVDSILHECLHELHPEWSETTVLQQTGKLMAYLSDAQVGQIYGEYRRRIEDGE